MLFTLSLVFLQTLQRSIRILPHVCLEAEPKCLSLLHVEAWPLFPELQCQLWGSPLYLLSVCPLLAVPALVRETRAGGPESQLMSPMSILQDTQICLPAAEFQEMLSVGHITHPPNWGTFEGRRDIVNSCARTAGRSDIHHSPPLTLTCVLPPAEEATRPEDIGGRARH